MSQVTSHSITSSILAGSRNIVNLNESSPSDSEDSNPSHPPSPSSRALSSNQESSSNTSGTSGIDVPISDPFEPLLLMLENGSPAQINPTFARILIGLLRNAREVVGPRPLDDQLLGAKAEIRMLEARCASLEAGRTPEGPEDIGLGRTSPPSLSPSDSVSQGHMARGSSMAPSEGSFVDSYLINDPVYCNDNHWNAQPLLPLSILDKLTWEDLENQTHARLVDRMPFNGLRAKRALWTFIIANKRLKVDPKTNVLKTPSPIYLLQVDGSPIPEDEQYLHGQIRKEAKVIATVLFTKRPPIASDSGVTFFETNYRSAWNGALALIEARHPYLQIAADHWKAKATIFMALNWKREKEAEEQRKRDLALVSPDAMSSTSQSDQMQASPSEPNLGKKGSKAATARVSKPRARKPTGITQPLPSFASPMRTQAKRSSEHGNTPNPRTKKSRPASNTNDSLGPASPSPIRVLPSPRRAPPSPSGQPEPTTDNVEDVSMDTSVTIDRDNVSVSLAAARLALGTQPPIASNPDIIPGTGRVRVDISSLMIPACQFSVVQQYLGLRDPCVSQATVTKLIYIVSAMAVNPTHLSGTPSAAARSLAHNLFAIDPNDPTLDDDNNDTQFGHSVYSGNWKDATGSWSAIGTANMALELLVGGLRVAEITHYICPLRRVDLPPLPLSFVYFDEMIDAITNAWKTSGGSAPRNSAALEAVQPRPTTSRATTSHAAAKAASEPFSYLLNGKRYTPDSDLAAAFAGMTRDVVFQLMIELKHPALPRASKQAMLSSLDQVYRQLDDAKKQELLEEVINYAAEHPKLTRKKK